RCSEPSQRWSGGFPRASLHRCRGRSIVAAPTATVSDFPATYGDVPPTALPKRRDYRSRLYTGRTLREHRHPWRGIPILASPTATVSDFVVTCGDTPPTGWPQRRVYRS